jgi:hypothetical protein
MQNDTKPVIEQTYTNERTVVCARCHGAKEVFNGDTEIICPLCAGTGMLRRYTEGVVKYYIIK